MDEKQDDLTWPTSEERKALDDLVTRANAGDEDALQMLRGFLDRNPQIWSYVGNLARTAERAWITLIAEGNSLAAEAILRVINEVRQNLAGEEPSAVESLLCDQVVATLLEVKYLEMVTANVKGGTLTQFSRKGISAIGARLPLDARGRHPGTSCEDRSGIGCSQATR